jgi:hypothetical protein
MPKSVVDLSMFALLLVVVFIGCWWSLWKIFNYLFYEQIAPEMAKDVASRCAARSRGQTVDSRLRHRWVRVSTHSVMRRCKPNFDFVQCKGGLRKHVCVCAFVDDDCHVHHICGLTFRSCRYLARRLPPPPRKRTRNAVAAAAQRNRKIRCCRASCFDRKTSRRCNRCRHH